MFFALFTQSHLTECPELTQGRFPSRLSPPLLTVYSIIRRHTVRFSDCLAK